MAEYIEREALMKNFCGYDLTKCVKYGNENAEQRHDSYSTMMMYEIADEIDDAPSADVAPVQWIRARERKPEDSDELVLAIVSGRPKRNITLKGAYKLATYDKEEGWILEEYPEWEGACVTHWMPLPEAPEKEEE